MMLRGINVLVALVLSQGWQWARIAEEHKLIGGFSFALLVVSFATLFLIQQYTGGFKEPAPRDKVRARAAVLDDFLTAFVSNYYKHIEGHLGQGLPVPAVRANVMLPVVEWFGLRKRLQICYKGCPTGVRYEREELDLYWSKNCGAAGWVWKTGQVEVCENNDDACNQKAWNTLPQTHVQAVKKVKSLISMPILEGGRPIGVLNLDGQEGLERTLFDSNEVRELVQRCAQGLPSLCFSHGVRPR